MNSRDYDHTAVIGTWYIGYILSAMINDLT